MVLSFEMLLTIVISLGFLNSDKHKYGSYFAEKSSSEEDDSSYISLNISSFSLTVIVKNSLHKVMV